MSTSTFLFPDVNVWLALTHEIHPRHKAAREWSDSLDNDAVVYFCRFTQLSLLRLLTNKNVMGADVLRQSQAWEVFDALVADPGNRIMEEPGSLGLLLRENTNSNETATKQWADGYLVAFATAAGVRLVTFDRVLAGKVEQAVLLGCSSEPPPVSRFGPIAAENGHLCET